MLLKLLLYHDQATLDWFGSACTVSVLHVQRGF